METRKVIAIEETYHDGKSWRYKLLLSCRHIVDRKKTSTGDNKKVAVCQYCGVAQ